MAKDSQEVSIDNWKPSDKKNTIPKSNWRETQIGTNFNQEPGLDELKKIQMFLKKKQSDSEIMKFFGINCETLVAIKKGKYSPIDGISLDNQSKIYKEFTSINKKLDNIMSGLSLISDNVFDVKGNEKRNLFRKTVGLRASNAKIKKEYQTNDEEE